MKVLWLVDGMSLVYRSYYAFLHNPLYNSKGFNTSVIFGVVNSLIKLMKEKNPKYMGVVFDARGPTFRHEEFEEYKKGRKKVSNEMWDQLPYLKEIVNLMGIKTIEIEGIEADDTIATLTEQAKKERWGVVIFTDDKDLFQLESETVKIFSPKKFKFITSMERLGVSPYKVVDFLTLVGDQTDNIKGVKGVGEKTAVKLIERFGSVEGIIKNVKKIEKKTIQQAIEQRKTQLLQNKNLIKLVKNYDIKIELPNFSLKEKNTKKLLQILQELECYSLIDKLNLYPKEKGFLLKINTLPSFSSEVTLLTYHGVISIFSSGTVSILYDAQKLTPIIEDERVKKITPNLKLLYKQFPTLRGEVFDVGIASYLLNPDFKKHSVERLANEWLNLPLKELKTEENFLPLLAKHTEVCYQLYQVLKKKLKEEELYELFEKIELPISFLLAKMEKKGVLIDTKYFLHLQNSLQQEITSLEEEIFQEVGEVFNLRSPQQLSYILFEKLKLPKGKRRKTGYSTDSSILLKLSEKFPIVKKIIKYRELYKLKSTYIDTFLELKDENNRIHTVWEQTEIATGRIASVKPNLQNIPRDEIRRGFISEEGYFLLSADYSQIELRILAAMSKEEKLLKAFEEEKDIHKETAAIIFNTKEEEVTPLQRNFAKAINFGIVYGMGPYGLKDRLKIGVDEAVIFIQTYFHTYPSVKEWINSQIEFARNYGYTQTLFGRKRWLPHINSNSPYLRSMDERVAVNTPIQGTVADMMKIAMLRIEEKLNSYPAEIIMQIHDELVLEVKEEVVEEVKEIVKTEMENLVDIGVPLKVDVGISTNWWDIHK